eukprot:TRINITY_DN23017_c0_g1_i1.p1 TRINITY_DN23017_c0_g1~~TRINITY_DN23017_c0_g1_i1.p1  ORF type:complete len:587 (-),score=180.72 TRINITY_DN23017_c0_g1_i1:364-1860(-)
MGVRKVHAPPTSGISKPEQPARPTRKKLQEEDEEIDMEGCFEGVARGEGEGEAKGGGDGAGSGSENDENAVEREEAEAKAEAEADGGGAEVGEEMTPRDREGAEEDLEESGEQNEAADAGEKEEKRRESGESGEKKKQKKKKKRRSRRQSDANVAGAGSSRKAEGEGEDAEEESGNDSGLSESEGPSSPLRGDSSDTDQSLVLTPSTSKKRPLSHKLLRRRDKMEQATASTMPAYKCGDAKLFIPGTLRGSWKQRWFVLNEEKLEIYKDNSLTALLSDIPLVVLTKIDPIVQLKAKDKKGVATAITIMSGELRLTVGFDDEREKSHWCVAINGLRAKNYKPCIDKVENHVLLNTLYMAGYKGGNVKGADEEEWSYRGNGVLRYAEGEESLEGHVFQWDGERLKSKCAETTANGQWTGVMLHWFEDEESNKPVLSYQWHGDIREYHSSDGDQQKTWKWTRHFLARKEGRGEWIMEGNVPEPVVMLLQLMKEWRCIQGRS